MLKKMLIIAGLLSIVSVGAQADEHMDIIENTVISDAIKDFTTYSGNGGAISNGNGYTLTIENDISNNTLQNTVGQAVFGGGIYQSGGSLIINNGVRFDKNTVIANSQTYPDFPGYVDNPAGGAIYINGNFNIKGNGTVTFSNNSVVTPDATKTEIDGSNGGAIFAQGSGDAKITFENVNFSNNSAISTGGAIYNGDTNITIKGAGVFENNTATSGGAVYNLDYLTNNTKFTTVEGSQFINNSATENGGAIANFDGVVNIGKDNEFSGNTAAEKGGAIYNANWQRTSVVNIKGGTTFTSNSANEVGGAIYTDGIAKIDTTDGDVIFSENISPKGADIYLDGKDSQLIVSGTNSDATVSFGSKNSIAGEGSITHQSEGTFEIKDNKNLNDFTGTYTQTSGKTTLNNSTIFNKFDIQAGALELINNSTATIDGVNKRFSGSNLIIDNSELTIQTAIDTTVNSNIKENGIINLEKNGSLTINSTDTWLGTINADEGKLTVNGFKDDVTYTQTNGGEITLTNKADLTLKDENSSISSGNVNVGGESALTLATGAKIEGDANTTVYSGSTVNVNGGTIDSTGKTDLKDGSNLNITNNGNVTLNSGDTWGGTINSDTGNLTVNGYKGDVTYTQTNGGEITLTNKADLTLKDENSSISSGNVNVNGNSALTLATGAKIEGDANTTVYSGSTVNVNGGTIDSTGKTNLKDGSELNITNGGSVTLQENDSWDGVINLGTEGLKEADNSTLKVGLSTDNTGELHAESGKLEVVNGLNLSVGKGSYIKEEVAIQTSGNIKITDEGYVAINDNDELKNGATLTLDGGTLDYGKTTDASALVVGKTGNLNLLKDSVLTISNNSKIEDTVALDIRSGAKLNLEKDLELNLDNEDKWHGHIYNQNGIINAAGVTDASGSLHQEDGEINLSQGSRIILDSDSTITGGDIKIEDNSSLTIVNATLEGSDNDDTKPGADMLIDGNSKFNVNSAKNAEFSLNSLTASAVKDDEGSIQSSSLINTMNAQLNRASIKTLDIKDQANFHIDILGRSTLRNDSDKFIIGKVANEDGIIRIDDWKLFGDVFGYDAPIDRHVQLGDIFVDEEGNQLEASIETTDTTNFSPIGWYQLNKGAGAGNYTLDLVKFNPQVFRGQVATVSQWMNQLSIDDMLFTHSMVLPSFKEEDGGKMANHYAAIDPLFAPYQYSRKDGGIWYKTYGTFEHLQMNNGLKHVGNNAYGALIGADFGLKDLENGWKFMPTAYVGYNGAHQYWSDVSQYQNGGQAGFLGTWYKDNFIVGAMLYGGVYGNNMDVYGHTDETFNYFAGTAAKASYNIKVHRDFVIQPNLMAAYNYFGQQNWHTNFGQMGMMSGMLHGVNIAPGVNFIWERETFSAYLTLQYMYNVNGASGGRAGNVHLPQLEMQRGYIQYGIGFTKKFTDRASGYFQAVLRNAGRTGVGLQAGFMYRIGKLPTKKQ